MEYYLTELHIKKEVTFKGNILSVTKDTTLFSVAQFLQTKR